LTRWCRRISVSLAQYFYEKKPRIDDGKDERDDLPPYRFCRQSSSLDKYVGGGELGYILEKAEIVRSEARKHRDRLPRRAAG
jgi:hypothetical protein